MVDSKQIEIYDERKKRLKIWKDKVVLNKSLDESALVRDVVVTEDWTLSGIEYQLKLDVLTSAGMRMWEFNSCDILE